VVLVWSDAQQPCSDQRPALDVVWLPPLLLRQFPGLLRRARPGLRQQVRVGQPVRGVRPDQLDRLAAVVEPEGGAQGLMPCDQVVEALLQGGQVEPPAQPEDHLEVQRRALAVQLLEDP
jgi:hypothetical protein